MGGYTESTVGTKYGTVVQVGLGRGYADFEGAALVGGSGGRELGFVTAGWDRSTVKGGANGERLEKDENEAGEGAERGGFPDFALPGRRIMAASRVLMPSWE